MMRTIVVSLGIALAAFTASCSRDASRESTASYPARDVTIMSRFILPNRLSPVIVQATFHLSLAIFIEASLSFIGMGTQPPTPSWGLMLNESRTFME